MTHDLTALPKAHLHLHLTGAMRHSTLVELALTGLTRKVLKRLNALPGYTGPRPAVRYDEVTPEIWV